MSKYSDIISDNGGFSLIETLVAVFMLSVVSLISLNVMSSYADSNQLMTAKTSHMEEIQSARDYLRNDLQNVKEDQFYTGSLNGDEQHRIFYLTRGNSELAIVDEGWSSAETIEYILADRQLIRRSFDRPNALETTNFRDYVLLRDVHEVEIRYYDGTMWQENRQVPANSVNRLQPRAIEITWLIDNNASSRTQRYRNRFQLGRDR